MAHDWSKPIVWGVTAPGVVTSVTTRVTFLGSPSYCGRCRRRQTYVSCSQCTANLCALCSWTVRLPPWGTKGIVDERCRECADK